MRRRELGLLVVAARELVADRAQEHDVALARVLRERRDEGLPPSVREKRCLRSKLIAPVAFLCIRSALCSMQRRMDEERMSWGMDEVDEWRWCGGVVWVEVEVWCGVVWWRLTLLPACLRWSASPCTRTT